MIKTLVFVTNYMNHHQKYLADEFEKILGEGYTFIETTQIKEEGKKFGSIQYDSPYVFKAYTSEENRKKALKLINEADVIITGFASKSQLIKRIRNNKLIFRYSERPLKGAYKLIKFPIRVLRSNYRNPKNKPIYLLSAGAYATTDYRKLGVFKNKAFKWGYFTKVIEYSDINKIIDQKKQNSLLWCGRIIECKHLEEAIYAVKTLIEKNWDINLNIIGDGPLKTKFVKLTKDLGIENHIHFLGVMNSDVVRTHMEKSSIFLFTSDFEEGWGAVLNESMNSGCAVVSSHAPGSAPYLILNNMNGLLYISGNIDDLVLKIEYLLNNPKKTAELGKNAYDTMINLWSPKIAAERFLQLANSILMGNIKVYDDGPCSIAYPIKYNWYKRK